MSVLLTKSSAICTETKLMLRRSFAAPVERVFRAWIDPSDLGVWYSPDVAWPVKIKNFDLRTGGGFTAEFGPQGETPYVELTEYRVIEPPTRLSFLAHLSQRGKLIELTLCDVEFLSLGDTTEVTLFEAGGNRTTLQDRERGWGQTLDNIDRVLS